MTYMEMLDTLLNYLVNLAILLFEYIGVGIIAYSGIQGLVNCLTRKPDARLRLAKGLALGLEFKMGSEILRTVVLRDLDELLIVAGIIALRAALTILIHWEIKNEEEDATISERLAQMKPAAAGSSSAGGASATANTAASCSAAEAPESDK